MHRKFNYLIFLTVLSIPAPIWAKDASVTEIHVTLLGQPCLLQGPFDSETLKSIHSLGPAQAYPTLSPPDLPGAAEQAHKAIEKLSKTTDLPPLLEGYREKLKTRLRAQSSFLDGLKSAQRATVLKKVGQEHLNGRDLKKFDALAKKLEGLKKGTSQYHEALDQVFDAYNDGIEPDPEAEFHRAIKKLKVQYNCSFEESDEPASHEPASKEVEAAKP